VGTKRREIACNVKTEEHRLATGDARIGRAREPGMPAKSHHWECRGRSLRSLAAGPPTATKSHFYPNPLAQLQKLSPIRGVRILKRDTAGPGGHEAKKKKDVPMNITRDSEGLLAFCTFRRISKLEDRSIRSSPLSAKCCDDGARSLPVSTNHEPKSPSSNRRVGFLRTAFWRSPGKPAALRYSMISSEKEKN
jgi:hypothetical protein